jgi:integrase
VLSTHPIQGDELRALRRLQPESPSSPFVFVSERGSPFTTAGLARMIERAAAAAGQELKAHPHMLRHACGYALANKGHDTRAIQGWLGHRSITSTAVYTALVSNRFQLRPPFASNNDPVSVRNDGAETGGAEPHIAEADIRSRVSQV